jgi:hypothetical protein
VDCWCVSADVILDGIWFPVHDEASVDSNHSRVRDHADVDARLVHNVLLAMALTLPHPLLDRVLGRSIDARMGLETAWREGHCFSPMNLGHEFYQN